MRPRSLTNSWFLTVTFVLLVLMISGTVISVVSAEKHRRLEAGGLKARELADFFDVHTSHHLQNADVWLRSARERYLNGGVPAIREFLSDIPSDSDTLSHITVIDRTGTPIFISGHTLQTGITAADRPYFLHQKNNTEDTLYLSLPFEGRNTGLLAIRLVRRIEAPGGQFDGVIFAAVPVEQFTQFFSALNLGPQSSATLVGLDKRIRARSSYGHLGPGQDISGSQLWQRLEEKPEGLYLQTSVVDGVTRHYAYKRMQEFPLIVAIGIAIGDIEHNVRNFAEFSYAIAALLSAVIAVLMYALHRRGVYLKTLEREILVRRSAEEEATRANEIKSTFLATMSHEVRTPINAIMGLFELIENADVPDRQKRQANAGQSAARDLFKQLVNVLDFSRLEARSLEVTIAPEHLEPMIDDFREVLEATTAQSSKPLETWVTVDPDVPQYVRLDRRRVHQIILNLIENAVKFTQCGSIGIRVSRIQMDGGYVLKISVQDTGIGISETELGKVFDRFGQLDSAITREAGGTGLGLSISKELAQLMRGELVVTSRPGEGSTFSLLLPLDDQDNS